MDDEYQITLCQSKIEDAELEIEYMEAKIYRLKVNIDIYRNIIENIENK